MAGTGVTADGPGAVPALRLRPANAAPVPCSGAFVLYRMLSLPHPD